MGEKESRRQAIRIVLVVAAVLQCVFFFSPSITSLFVISKPNTEADWSESSPKKADIQQTKTVASQTTSQVSTEEHSKNSVKPVDTDRVPPKIQSQEVQAVAPLIKQNVTYSWKLTKIPNITRCMDGSAGGIYFRSIRNAANTEADNSWLFLFVDGVGWCNHWSNCRPRGFGAPFHSSASSSKWKDQPGWAKNMELDGLLSDNSPFALWKNVVAFGYCDASAFAGRRRKVTLVGGKPYLFAGRWNLQGYLDHLISEHNLKTAEKIVLVGYQAGALAISLGSEWMQQYLKQQGINAHLSAVLEGGLYADVDTDTGKEQSRRMKMGVESWNATDSMPSACQADWNCIFPQQHAQHLNIDLFLAHNLDDDERFVGLYGGKEVKTEQRELIKKEIAVTAGAYKASGRFEIGGCGTTATDVDTNKDKGKKKDKKKDTESSLLFSPFCHCKHLKGVTPCSAVHQWLHGQKPSLVATC